MARSLDFHKLQAYLIVRKMQQVYLYIIGLMAFAMICAGSVSGEAMSRDLESPSFRIADQPTISTLDDETDTLMTCGINGFRCPMMH
jgi:hypothetical protein